MHERVNYQERSKNVDTLSVLIIDILLKIIKIINYMDCFPITLIYKVNMLFVLQVETATVFMCLLWSDRNILSGLCLYTRQSR